MHKLNSVVKHGKFAMQCEICGQIRSVDLQKGVRYDRNGWQALSDAATALINAEVPECIPETEEQKERREADERRRDNRLECREIAPGIFMPRHARRCVACGRKMEEREGDDGVLRSCHKCPPIFATRHGAREPQDRDPSISTRLRVGFNMLGWE